MDLWGVKMAEEVEFFCVKCKAKKKVSSYEKKDIKGKGGNVRHAITAKCPDCGTTMFKFVKG
jgi:Zn finger protein HypA/HybF involved in hydrogenase expression